MLLTLPYLTERMLMNVEVDYKLLTKRLSKRIFQLESELNKKLDDSDWMSSTPEISQHQRFVKNVQISHSFTHLQSWTKSFRN